jgi:hypothetical protein
VRRGLFVRRRLLCQDLGTPPPEAGGVPEIDPDATTRERFAQHSADPACAICHQHIDPLGFGFEAFDPIGRVRDSDAGKPIDASGALTDVEGLGTNTSAPFESLGELATLLASSHAAEACFARQSYRFVLGAKESDGDRCSLEALEDHFVASEGDMRELLVAITQLPSFVRRK